MKLIFLCDELPAEDSAEFDAVYLRVVSFIKFLSCIRIKKHPPERADVCRNCFIFCLVPLIQILQPSIEVIGKRSGEQSGSFRFNISLAESFVRDPAEEFPCVVIRKL